LDEEKVLMPTPNQGTYPNPELERSAVGKNINDRKQMTRVDPETRTVCPAAQVMYNTASATSFPALSSSRNRESKKSE
jgi:hypothetical protein